MASARAIYDPAGKGIVAVKIHSWAGAAPTPLALVGSGQLQLPSSKEPLDVGKLVLDGLALSRHPQVDRRSFRHPGMVRICLVPAYALMSSSHIMARLRGYSINAGMWM